MKFKWIVTGLFALIVGVVVAGYAILSTMDFEELRGVIEAEAKDATGRELKIAGAIDLKVSLTPAIALQDVTFANAAWGSQAQMVSVERFELEVALLPLLSGDIQVKRLVVVKPDILLETDRKGRGNWEMETGGEKTGEAEEDAGEMTLPSFDKAILRDAVLTFRDGKTGEETRVELARFEGKAAGPTAPLTIAVEGAYNGAPFKADGALGSFKQLLGEGSFPVKLAAEAGGATLDIEGVIAAPTTGQGINLKIRARGESLAGLGALSGAVLPPLGPYDLGAQVEQAETAYKLTGLTAKVGSSDIAGNAMVSLGGGRPTLNGTFTSANLRLDDVAPPGTEEAGAVPEGEQKFVFTEDPLPLEGLKAADVTIKLTVKQLALRGDLTLSDVDLSLALRNGNLTVKPFSLGVAGGTLAGEFSLDAGKSVPPVTVNLTASRIDYGRLLKERKITDGVTGTLDAKVRLRGAGASARAIAAGLGGHVDVVGGQGSVRSDLLQGAGAGLTDLFSVIREGDSDLRLNCVVARLPIKGGVATSEAILVDTDAATVGGTGKIDLRDESLDLRVTPQAKQTSLMSLAVPFLIGGTLASPSVGPDPVGTAVGAAKIAGMFINPLAAGALIVLESESSDQNPCVTALEGGGQAPAASDQQPAQQGGGIIEDTAKGAKDAVEGVGEGITKGLKSLFGN